MQSGDTGSEGIPLTAGRGKVKRDSPYFMRKYDIVYIDASFNLEPS
jgi:hypothetical protein